MTTMTKAQLVDFRERLVRAKELARECIGSWYACRVFNLPKLSDADETWYHSHATKSERIAMWDNSIAHANKLIEEAE